MTFRVQNLLFLGIGATVFNLSLNMSAAQARSDSPLNLGSESLATAKVEVGAVTIATVPELNAGEPNVGASNTTALSDQTTYDDPLEPSNMAQINSISQLSDVQPTDWAYEALSFLVTQYDCLEGYPDGTFRGDRVISRYEFAAGLSACLDVLLSQDSAINPEELITLERLQSDFALELETLKGRVDLLESQTAELTANQFSTTTILFGQVVLGIQGRTENTADFFPVDGTPETDDPSTQINLITNIQLSLATQFSPTSFLLTGLQAGSGTTSPRLSNDTRLAYEGNTSNRLVLSDLTYRQLIGDDLALIIGAAGVNPVNVFRGANRVEGLGSGPLSAFAQRNPILSIGSGRAGAGFDWQIAPRISFQGVYATSLSNDPELGGLFGSREGDTTLGAQLTLAPTNNLDIALTYINSYSPSGSLKTGIGDDQLTVSAPLNTDAFGATIAWLVNPRLTLGAWGGYTHSEIPDQSGAVETTNWMVFLNFPDLFEDGNLGGIYVGQPPKIVSSDLRLGQNVPDRLAGGLGAEGDQPGTTTHVEVFYRHRLTDNISITPGFILLFDPGNTSGSDTVGIGVLRTTFNF